MNFLDPAAIALAAGLTVPPLVALYFLKLKRAVRFVPSTLLWKRAVEDLRVNAPFQRLRRSLLLLLQLLVLALAAFALGKPMWETAETHESTMILLIDQSASMSVVEEGGRTRLDLAKEQAKRCVDNMNEDARAMVIAFCDRATVVSSFDSDRRALQRKIDSIEPTQSTTSLGEAVSLAEAYAQNLMIGGEQPGADIAPEPAAPPATVFLFTDGRIEDAAHVAAQKLDVAKMRVSHVGARGDNVGIVAMEARRNYDHPERLEVTTAVRNFGPDPVALDVVLYIDGRNVDMQSIQLDPADPVPSSSADLSEPRPGSFRIAAFDDITFEGGGVVEVILRIEDALPTDDRAWTVIDPPRRTRALLVTEGNMFLETLQKLLPLDLVTMSGEAYESAADSVILEGERSAFDVVILDRHSTARLPRGNYLFWGSTPRIPGVIAGGTIKDQVIFNWDETHPVLRHVAVETIHVGEWLHLTLPPEAVSIIDGETSPVMAYLTRDASQFLISAFSLIVNDERGVPYKNTDWIVSVDFVVFLQNAIHYLAANIAATGKKSIAPGEPVTLPVPRRAETVNVIRPDGVTDPIPVGEYETIHYARTRHVGTYRLEPGVSGDDVFAVNLFNANESQVAPAATVTLGGDATASQAGSIDVNKPAWPMFLLALVGLLLLEWIVYNHRVFV